MYEKKIDTLTWLNVGTYFIGRYLGFFGGKKSKKSRA